MHTSSGWLLSCDPGLRAVGVALFRDGVLVRAAALRGPATGRGPAVWQHYACLVDAWVGEHVPVSALAGPCNIVIELMKVQVKGKGDPSDLIELSGVSGAIVGRMVADRWQAVGFEPSVYKGQVPRDIYGARIEGHLRAEGLWSCVEVPSRATELNDAMHAVGLGRWYLGR
jgi:hypothetical protein